jgi:D-glycero-alpha-D-manno-heptose-7-phosphate kinase
MIISRTPFRVSFAGGGTDLAAFYRKTDGAVTSTTVDKYMYIMVNSRFDDTIRVSYRNTEIVNDVDELEHPIVREALKQTGILRGIEITSMADMPAGTGLGSSSSFTVGLLHALYAWQGKFRSAEQLAAEASHIEIELLGEPIGKQDQYAAAYGGLNLIRFNEDDSVYVDPVICHPERRRELFDNLQFFYTGGTRSASAILKEQKKSTGDRMEFLTRMRDQADQIREILINGRDLAGFGELLHAGWQLKRQITGGISNPAIDEWYEKARDAGAIGGKLLGAGGGGFLAFFVKPERQRHVQEALKELRQVKMGYEPQGSKIIYIGG